MQTDQKPTRMGWRNLRLIEWDSPNSHAHAKAREHAKDEEHSDILACCLNCTTEDHHSGRNSNGTTTGEVISRRTDEKSTKEATCLEQAIGSSDQCCSIVTVGLARKELHIVLETRLSQGRCDDGRAVAIG